MYAADVNSIQHLQNKKNSGVIRVNIMTCLNVSGEKYVMTIFGVLTFADQGEFSVTIVTVKSHNLKF